MTDCNPPGTESSVITRSTGDPGLLKISTVRDQSGSKETLTRSGAADASRRASSGRNKNTRASVPCAQTWSRRTCSARTCGSQASTAPADADRMSCSAAQSRSAGCSARTQIKRRSSMPSHRRPAMHGWRGGPMTTISRPAAVTLRSAGARSRHSSVAGWAASTSVTPRKGQPPDGSASSSSCQPLATEQVLPVASCVPLQMHAATCGGRAFSRRSSL